MRIMCVYINRIYHTYVYRTLISREELQSSNCEGFVLSNSSRNKEKRQIQILEVNYLL